MQTITIMIDEAVKDHFNQLTSQAGSGLDQEIINKSLNKIKQLTQACENESLIHHLMSLKDMIHMLNEPQWNLSHCKAERINATLAYFLNEHDIIPDNTPGVGYLDDCIVIQSTKEHLNHELNDYLDFQDKQRVYGKNKCFNQQDWRKIKQQESNSRLRNRRARFAIYKRSR